MENENQVLEELKLRIVYDIFKEDGSSEASIEVHKWNQKYSELIKRLKRR